MHKVLSIVGSTIALLFCVCTIAHPQSQFNDTKFLTVDQAFQYKAEVKDAETLVVQWIIADGYYLYKNKIKLSLEKNSRIVLGKYELPQAQVKQDQYIGETHVYLQSISIELPLIRQNQTATELILVAKYQGCAEKGLCYQPMTQKTTLIVPAVGESVDNAEQISPVALLSEQGQIVAALSNSGLLINLLSFFGLGLLLAFSPCVYPMIPILSSIIVGEGNNITTKRAFILSLVYVLSVSITYAIAGVLAGIFGANLQTSLQTPWILVTFSAVFVALSFSMFGFYQIQVPSFLQAKLAQISNRQSGGTLGGVVVMGFLSALIVGPCVTAPLASALMYIGQTGDALLGGLALFSLSIGMGTPLLIIGTSAGKFLPRAGVWMDKIKSIFGVLLLAVAIWMLERVLPAQITLYLWAALLIIPSVYMGALEPLGENISGWKKFFKGIGIMMLVYGVILILSATSGGNDPMRPFQHMRSNILNGTSTETIPTPLNFRLVKGVDDVEKAIVEAAGKPVMLDFYADWCVSCKELEHITFADDGVRNALSGFVLLQADVTANDEKDKELQSHYKIFGPPAILFFDSSGKELKNFRLIGFIEPKRLRGHIKRAFSRKNN